MPHVFEIAPTGRARCRGCGESIAKSEVRFGEKLPNPFGDGDMTLWFHPPCAAFKRPEPFLATLDDTDVEVTDRQTLERHAKEGIAHRRLPRVDGAERSPSGRARCRSCRELIERDSWRIRLVYYQEGQFAPSGFVHTFCSRSYFETTDLAERAARFSKLTEDDLSDLRSELSRVTGDPSESPTHGTEADTL